MGPAPTSGSPPWLAVIDMQNVFVSPGSPWHAHGVDALVGNVRALVEGFGERVVFTRFIAPARPEGAWADYYREWSFALVAADDPIYDLVDSLPSGGHPVVSRTTFGKWDDEPGSLREVTSAAQTLVLSGVSTDCCVLSTALAAADAGIQVQVVADACAGVTRADHERALDVMSLYTPLITLTSTAQVLGEG